MYWVLSTNPSLHSLYSGKFLHQQVVAKQTEGMEPKSPRACGSDVQDAEQHEDGQDDGVLSLHRDCPANGSHD